ncbi:hypothetical protein PLEOSDRAFT_171890 [Pleurotus ostreatus PC15]|uniref:Uncharacterized protein n=1 Tax=Pleurotus ostreatus (strain PC15) TaxID=1137138 RepID=A0A067NWM4_PLEO1|nr:hypothetical protein PLEOSDRAFT_171890 [Pleurotus ostreatus PC15]
MPSIRAVDAICALPKPEFNEIVHAIHELFTKRRFRKDVEEVTGRRNEDLIWVIALYGDPRSTNVHRSRSDHRRHITLRGFTRRHLKRISTIHAVVATRPGTFISAITVFDGSPRWSQRAFDTSSRIRSRSRR